MHESGEPIGHFDLPNICFLPKAPPRSQLSIGLGSHVIRAPPWHFRAYTDPGQVMALTPSMTPKALIWAVFAEI